jgi:hypothetical protein
VQPIESGWSARFEMGAFQSQLAGLGAELSTIADNVLTEA